jgi:formylglycine-generating enzyme required for sulfatase activity
MHTRCTAAALLMLWGCSTSQVDLAPSNQPPRRAEHASLPSAAAKDTPALAKDSPVLAKTPPAPAKGECQEGMAYVPGGTFMMGTTPDDARDALHQVTITKPYCIDRLPITVAEYRPCLQAGVCTVPKKPLDYNYDREGRDHHPVNAVTWDQANTYCSWVNKRLPTDAEWVLAALGTDGRKFPWGNEEPDDTRLHWSRTTERAGTAPVGSYPAGASPYGVLDMLGNVDQWLADWDGVYSKSSAVDPTGPASAESRVIRGYAYDGGRLPEAHYFRRFSLRGDFASPTTGFRCGLSATR